MELNEIKATDGARQSKRRVGRGIGSGLGKTCGRGHKGQHARAGGFHKVGFEGGQMPLQRRLPKVGFKSPKAGETQQVMLYQLSVVEGEITLDSLRAAKLIDNRAKRAKIVKQGEIDRAVTIRGVAVTAGAKSAIEAAGGSVEA
ncbi:MAG: 50S ribosomal protein L15 [Xanthomonadales bacterium]|nr:50S ribosomal protein L15 [Xanthomonadales bacterium]MCB1635424.1 50S ribosomal protein L15 [Xanthomonadales bacterium]